MWVNAKCPRRENNDSIAIERPSSEATPWFAIVVISAISLPASRAARVAQFLTLNRPLPNDTLVYVSEPVQRNRSVANRICLRVHHGS